MPSSLWELMFLQCWHWGCCGYCVITLLNSRVVDSLTLWRIVPPSSSRVHQNHNPGDQSTFRLASFSVDMKPYHCLTFFIHLMFFSSAYPTTHCLFVTFPIHLLIHLPVNVILNIVCLFGHQVMLHLFVLKEGRLFERWLLNLKMKMHVIRSGASA